MIGIDSLIPPAWFVRITLNMEHPHRKTVGIRFPQWTSLGPGVLSGVVDFMRNHELWRIVTENNSYGEMEAVKIDGRWHGDGVILFRAAESELAAFRERGMAVVLTSTEGPDLGAPRVVPDNHAIGRLAAQHLIEGNHSKLAFLARGETFYLEEQYAPGMRIYARERLKGFRAALFEYALEPQVHYLTGRPLWEPETWIAVQAEVTDFLRTLPRPCGLFVADDSLAAVVLRAADAMGVTVPDELAVIGYGDDPSYCYSTCPALSSIVHPAAETGRLAAELLWRQMNGETVTGSHILPVSQVVSRESSEAIAIEDLDIRKAVGWIRQAAPHDPLRVTEVAERIGLSVTTLKERFAKTLGVSPKQEIQRVRLKHLTHLLVASQEPLAVIAGRMGFGSAHELGRFFRSETGVTPGQFRKAKSSLGPPAAVIFDMDGTLFDSESLYFEAFQCAYAEQGGVLTREEYFQRHAGTTNETIEASLGSRAPADFDAERFSRRWRECWDRLLDERGLVPLPGVVDWLKGCKAAGVAVAVASSSSLKEIARCLECAGLDRWFKWRTGGDEVSNGKPDPDIFILAIARLGIEPTRCLVIEDSPAGVAGARAAGIKVIQVSPHLPASMDPKVKRVGSLGELERSTAFEWFRQQADVSVGSPVPIDGWVPGDDHT